MKLAALSGQQLECIRLRSCRTRVGEIDISQLSQCYSRYHEVRGQEIVPNIFTDRRAIGSSRHWCVERGGGRISALAPLRTSSVTRTRGTVDLLAEAECAAEWPERGRIMRGSVFH